MSEEICNWIDKSIFSIKNQETYEFYFSKIEENKIEDSIYLSNREKGVEIVLSLDQIIVSIHFLSGNTIGYAQYKGSLPHEIEFSFTRDDVQNKLGTPQKHGGGYKDVFSGHIPFWDKYLLDKYSLHLQYNAKEEIDIITIGSLKLESYFNIALQ